MHTLAYCYCIRVEMFMFAYINTQASMHIGEQILKLEATWYNAQLSYKSGPSFKRAQAKVVVLLKKLKQIYCHFFFSFSHPSMWLYSLLIYLISHHM